MAGLTRAVEAGKAFIRVTVDNDEAAKKFRRSLHEARRFARQISAIGKGMMVVGGAAAASTIPFVKASADAESAMIRFRMIFREATDEGIARVKALSNEFGTGFRDMIGQTATFAAIFTDMRRSMSDEQFMDVVMRTQRVAIQLSTMMGISMPEAAERLKSAFTSTGEAVDQFGINVRQAELAAEAQRLGLGNNIRAMSEATKQLIKLSIMERTFRDMGYDAEQATSSFNTQLAFLQSQLYDVRVNLGIVLRAGLTPLLKAMNRAVAESKGFAVMLSPLIALVGLKGASLAGVGATVTFLSELTILIAGLPLAIKTLTPAVLKMAAMFRGLSSVLQSLIVLNRTLLIQMRSWGTVAATIYGTQRALWAAGIEKKFAVFGGASGAALQRAIRGEWPGGKGFTPFLGELGKQFTGPGGAWLLGKLGFNPLSVVPSPATPAAESLAAGASISAAALGMGPRIGASLQFAGAGGSGTEKAIADLGAIAQRAFDSQEGAIRVTGS